MALTDLALSSRAGDPRGGLLSLAGDERRRDPLLSLRGERLLSLSLLGERLLQKKGIRRSGLLSFARGGMGGCGWSVSSVPPHSLVWALRIERRRSECVGNRPHHPLDKQELPSPLSLSLSIHLSISIYLSRTDKHTLSPSPE